MKREIKFRQPVYNKDGSFKEWFYWGLFKDTGEWVNIHAATKQFAHPQKITDPHDSTQFTGLLDKNGKEIYEGDICEGHSDGIGVITWTEFDGGYDYIFTNEANVGIWEVKKEIKVIGNIYEQPDLLTTPTGG